MNLKTILNKYDTLESELLYNKAKDLFDLISDSEIEDILKLQPEGQILLDLSNKSTEDIKKDKALLNAAIFLFINVLESRNLTEDEYESMTLDDVKTYIDKLITKKDRTLLNIIHNIENIYK